MIRFYLDVLYTVPIVSGFGAFFWLLMDRSEEKNALIFGLSKFRILLAGIMLVLCGLSWIIFANRRKRLKPLWFFSALIGIISAEILLFSRFPCDDTRNLIPLIADRAKPLLIWAVISSCSWLLALRLANRGILKDFAFFTAGTAITAYWVISAHISRTSWNVRLENNNSLCLLSLAALILWYLALNSGISRSWKTAAGFLFFTVFAYAVTRSTGMWMGRINTPSKAYWNELAESFLHGHLELLNPAGFHDLTFYDGKWYVPNPPLPAILLMPVTVLLGSAEAVNMSVYSAVIAGINAGLFFLMLIFAFTREGGPLYTAAADDDSYPAGSLSAAVWVTLLFVFGTDHLWLGTTGQMWFISQLLVVGFTLLGCICVICGSSPVLAGIALGCAVLCRPNIFPVWLCMLGIWLNRENEFPRINWKRTFIWSLKSGIPVVIAVFLLLFYNKIRFDDWMDFGYVTINGADWIMESVKKYGMFHPHFLKINADVMIFGLPRLDFSGERFFFQPYLAGYSIFIMTPPLIYIFRAFRKNWASIGNWCSVLLSVALLLLYHNTGAEQIGYRYLLDFAAPLALLTADGLKGKPGILYKILTVFSVILSFIAIYWWYLGRV